MTTAWQKVRPSDPDLDPLMAAKWPWKVHITTSSEGGGPWHRRNIGLPKAYCRHGRVQMEGRSGPRTLPETTFVVGFVVNGDRAPSAW